MMGWVNGGGGGERFAPLLDSPHLERGEGRVCAGLLAWGCASAGWDRDEASLAPLREGLETASTQDEIEQVGKLVGKYPSTLQDILRPKSLWVQA